MVYMVTFTINIPPMLVYIPYMDPMGYKSLDLPSGKLLHKKLWKDPPFLRTVNYVD